MSFLDEVVSQGAFSPRGKDRLYVMTNPRFEKRQLVFPMDITTLGRIAVERFADAFAKNP